MNLSEEQRYLLESAIRAPSADNLHRIRFESLAADEIRIRLTGAPLAHQEGGYKRVLTLLSLGAVAENLSIAASRYGILTETKPFPDPSDPDLAVVATLKRGVGVADSLWTAIPERHTNRRVVYRGPKLSAEEQQQLELAAQAVPECNLIWLDDGPIRQRALSIMRRAETERFRNRVLHEELFSAIRFDAGWQASCQEGLPSGALGVEPPLRPFFALLRHWPVMRVANLLGAHYMLGWRACDLPCRLAPNLGLLAVRNTDTQSVFDAGRAFQRVWLTATQQGRVLQPMPASALYALEGAQEEGIPKDLQRSLAEAWRRLTPGLRPLVLFRMGRARPTAVHTGRRELSVYLAAE
jgi:hypothetical protein